MPYKLRRLLLLLLLLLLQLLLTDLPIDWPLLLFPLMIPVAFI
jgi:hypothetical protein